MSDLDEMLTDAPTPGPTPEAEAPAQEAAPEQPAEATGEADAPPAAEGGEDAGVEEDSSEGSRQVPLAALKAEREKRQDLERQMATLQGEKNAYREMGSTKQPEQPQESAEDRYYKDPVGFTQNLVSGERLRVSEAIARGQHEDYDTVIESFVEASKQSPGLIAQMNASDLPAQFAYNHGKEFAEAKEMGSIDQLREKIRTEERAKLEAEMKKETALGSAGSISPSTAGARNVGAQAGGPVGDDSLKSVLGR